MNIPPVCELSQLALDLEPQPLCVQRSCLTVSWIVGQTDSVEYKQDINTSKYLKYSNTECLL